MKASPQGRLRPRIQFSQTPHSITRRARALPHTAGELLRYLCEMTIGFGKGSIALTYQSLAETLGRDWSTIARAVRLLRRNGDIDAEPLRDGSYRWSVVLESSDVVADPEGIYRVRSMVSAKPEQVCSHGKNAMTPMAKTPCPHGKNAMTPMAKTPWGGSVAEEAAQPIAMRVSTSMAEVEKEPLKKHLKDTCSKKHQQTKASACETPRGSDDEPLGHKKLLEELIALGSGQRMARKLLRNHEHAIIAHALEKVRFRTDIDNPVGYLIREVEDGGYEDSKASVKPSDDVSRETPKLSPAFSSGYERTQAEAATAEAERVRKQTLYRMEVQAMLQRFQGLPEELRTELKTRARQHLESLVPNTAKKAMLMEEQRFQKIAFKETASRFFGLIDEGLRPVEALEQLAVA